MTKAQKKTIARIMEWVLKYDCFGNHQDFEIKSFHVKQIKHGLLQLDCTAGRKDGFEYANWEYLITIRKLVIGLRGGVTAYVWSKENIREKVFRGWTTAMESGYTRYGDDRYGDLPTIE